MTKKEKAAEEALELEMAIEDLKEFFRERYSYIALELSDKEIGKFLNRFPRGSWVHVEKMADKLQDYILANGLSSDVQP